MARSASRGRVSTLSHASATSRPRMPRRGPGPGLPAVRPERARGGRSRPIPSGAERRASGMARAAHHADPRRSRRWAPSSTEDGWCRIAHGLITRVTSTATAKASTAIATVSCTAAPRAGHPPGGNAGGHKSSSNRAVSSLARLRRVRAGGVPVVEGYYGRTMRKARRGPDPAGLIAPLHARRTSRCD
jgi:hypothetical protein